MDYGKGIKPATANERSYPMNKFRDFFITLISIALILSIFITTKLFGVVSPEQKEKINQDITILENVLDQLIVKESPFLFNSSDHVKGIYLDGFGIIFNSESNGLVGLSTLISMSLDKIPRVRINRDERGELQLNIDEQKKNAKTAEQQAEEIEKSLQKTEELLTKFYLDYASMLKSLNESDRICVNINNNQSNFIGNYDEALQVPVQLCTCVGITELQDFRRGKTNETKLRSLIKINRIYEKDRDNDIDIMERILDKSLGQESNRPFLSFKGQTHGMYLDGFGAVFFSPLSYFDRLEKFIVRKTSEIEKKVKQDEAQIKQQLIQLKQHEKELKQAEAHLKQEEASGEKKSTHYTIVTPGNIHDTINIVLPKPPEPPEPYEFDFDFIQTTRLTEHELDSLINVTTDNIIKVLGQYGTTLKKVKKDEYVLVSFEISVPRGEKASSICLKVKKSDIERFARDEIDLEKLKKSVEISRS